jgi:hypothetical protein
MSKPLKQVIVFSENYGHEVEKEVNAWLSNRANDVYEHTLSWFAADHYITCVIAYWEEKS